jgi:hypothetical protein
VATTEQLESNRSYFVDRPDGATKLLLGWPLPGARVGPPYYQLFLIIPQTGAKCQFVGEVNPASDTENSRPPSATGFVVQARGRNAGRAQVEGGWADMSPGRKLRSGAFDLQFSDGTTMAGTFRAIHAPIEIRTFEDQVVAEPTGGLAPAP